MLSATATLPSMSKKSLAIVASVAGALSLLMCLFATLLPDFVAIPLAGILAITGLITGILSLRKREKERGNGLSITGLVLSGLGLAGFTFLVVTAFLLSENEGNATEEAMEWFQENVPADYDPITNNSVDEDIAREMYRSLSDEQLGDLCDNQPTATGGAAPAEAALVANGWLPLEPLFAAAGVDEIDAAGSFVLLDFNVLVGEECVRRDK